MATPTALELLEEEQDISSGELLALKWEDVDLEGSTIRVRGTLTRVRGKVSLGEPKTKKSCRSDNRTVAAVEAPQPHLTCQLEEMERMSSLYQSGGLVFANEIGGIINPSNLRNRSFAGC